jgi:hypothetical protein
VLAFGEQHLLHDAVDLRMDRDRERGLRGAETGDVDRNVLSGRDRDVDRHRPAGRERGAGGFGPRCPIPVDAAARQDDKDGGDRHNATAARSCALQIGCHEHLPRQILFVTMFFHLCDGYKTFSTRTAQCESIARRP